MAVHAASMETENRSENRVNRAVKGMVVCESSHKMADAGGFLLIMRGFAGIGLNNLSEKRIACWHCKVPGCHG